MTTAPYPMIDSPLRWPGGKSRLRARIIGLLPPHRRYLEPFAGGAWVLLGKPPSAEEVLGDSEPELVNFYRVLQASPQAFLDSFAWDLCSRAEFERLRALDVGALGDVERARRFYYLVMAGWGAEYGYARFQTAIADGGHGNRLIGALLTLQDRILPVHRRLQGVRLEECDWRESLARYDGPDTVAYLDPPYPANKVHYSRNMRGWESHEDMADVLSRTACRWVLSLGDHPRVRAIYGPYNLIPVQFASGQAPGSGERGRVLNRELLITNFDVGPASGAPRQGELWGG
jgi:DNA adenine methylase